MRPIDAIGRRRKVDNFSQFFENDHFGPLTQTPKPKRPHKKNTWKIKTAVILTFVFIFTAAFADDVLAVAQLGRNLRNGRFLVLFQNNAELRPTGGFLGSFAVVSTQNGRIKQYSVEGNIYKADNEFVKTHKILTPEPFRKIWPDGYMAFNSSNWSPDFPTAAKQISWYYEQEYGDSTLDGVIALNSTAVAQLMKLAGSIELPAEKVTFTPDNFLTVLQKYVEKDYYDETINQNKNEPKAILSELGTQLLSRLTQSNPITLAYLVRQFLETKELQIYFINPEKQLIAHKMDWSLEVPSWDGNYLYINNANLGGGKGSLNVIESVSYEIKPNTDKTSEVLLNINRENLGRGDYPVADNLNYTRVLVPLGSSLNYGFVDGKDISDQMANESELQKTVFGFWFNTAVGQKSQARLSYTVPALANGALWLEHQPGTVADNVTVIENSNELFLGKLLKKKIIDIL